MSSPVTVWESLALQGTPVAKGVPYIDPNTFQPTVDATNFEYDPDTKILKPRILDVMDYIETAKKLGIWRTLAASAVEVLAPANTNENLLAQVTIPANALGANGGFRATAFWNMTNNGNNKTVGFRFPHNSSYVWTKVYTAAQFVISRITLWNRGAVNSQLYISEETLIGGSILLSRGTLAVNTALNNIFAAFATKAVAGDTIGLDYLHLEILSKD